MDQARTLQGKTLYGAGGDKLGKIDTLYADRDGGEPTFATVQTGLFGSKTHFVPLAQASMRGDDAEVPYDKDLVNNAPAIDPDSELEPHEEERLYQHYGVSDGYDSTVTTGNAGTVGDYDTTTAATTTATTGTADYDTQRGAQDDAMTRSEERLQVGTQRREAGRARLRKFITAETVTQTVPVSREEVTVRREPITDANRDRAYDGPELTEQVHEVVLTEEVPVVAKETVAVERIALDTETVTDQVQVTEQVRKENIVVEGGDDDLNRGATGGGIDGDPTTRR